MKRRRGCITKVGRTFWVVFRVQGKQKWIKGGDTPEEAEKVLTQKLSELDQGNFKEVPKVTFQEFAEKWLEVHMRTLKPSTQHHQEEIVRVQFSSFNEKLLASITPLDVESWISERLKKVTPRTLQPQIAILKQLFKDALNWGYLKQNPTGSIKALKVFPKEPRILTPEECRLVLEHINSHYSIPVELALWTGMRSGELWGLRWEDLDPNAFTLKVQRSVWGNQFQAPKSPCSVRTIYLTPSLVGKLKLWKLRSGSRDLMFPSHKGGIVNHLSFLTSFWYPALKRAKVPKVNFHSLRHSNVSLRIEAGQSPKFIQQQLGHSGIQTTFNIYGHLMKDGNFSRQQTELLEQRING